MPRLAVFTDLDGTLLDHASYSHAPAAPALAELKARSIPLVLASSKTAAEIAVLHRALNLGPTPAIVENGAGLFDPVRKDPQEATAYLRIRAALDTVPPPLRAKFRGFGDMDSAEIAERTGLPPDGAKGAANRCHSEPGLWSGTPEDEAAFVSALAEQGISARRGGRFLTLSFGATKADRLHEIAARLGAERTIALGDAPNDIEMLQAADHGVIVRNDHGTPMPELDGEATGRIRRSLEPGPTGWNTAILGLLAELDNEGHAT